jgi:hypothetical protein
MGKNVPDAVQDALLDYVDLSNIQHICSAEPANYAGIAAVSLGSVAMTPNTDFTKAAGTTGRKITVAAKNGVTITGSGTATHLVLALTSDSTLRAVTTCTSQAVVAAQSWNIPAWELEVGDPT